MINNCYDNYCDDIVSINESSNGFKFEYTHTLEANTYLEERKEELTKILDDSDKILLRAPTGAGKDRKSTRLNSSHSGESRMPSSA